MKHRVQLNLLNCGIKSPETDQSLSDLHIEGCKNCPEHLTHYPLRWCWQLHYHWLIQWQDSTFKSVGNQNHLYGVWSCVKSRQEGNTENYQSQGKRSKKLNISFFPLWFLWSYSLFIQTTLNLKLKALLRLFFSYRPQINGGIFNWSSGLLNVLHLRKKKNEAKPVNCSGTNQPRRRQTSAEIVFLLNTFKIQVFFFSWRITKLWWRPTNTQTNTW